MYADDIIGVAWVWKLRNGGGGAIDIGDADIVVVGGAGIIGDNELLPPIGSCGGTCGIEGVGTVVGIEAI